MGKRYLGRVQKGQGGETFQNNLCMTNDVTLSKVLVCPPSNEIEFDGSSPVHTERL